ncbi:MAG TPA: hypothetical protein VJT73_03300 [Polyangiaceae bacterium]|nr:hypothetical protein [Polyangiaceae bacterium]
MSRRLANGVHTACFYEGKISLDANACDKTSAKCGGVHACAIDFTISGLTQTVDADGYTLRGEISSLTGTLDISSPAVTCAATPSFPVPVPFAVHYRGAHRTDCSENVALKATYEFDASSLTFSGGTICDALALNLRKRLGESLTTFLRDHLFAPPACAACKHDGCPSDVVCRP